MVILIHSSKTMQSLANNKAHYQKPRYIKEATQLQKYLSALPTSAYIKDMKLSANLADKTKQLVNSWSYSPNDQTPAAECFLGDIYSGLQFNKLTDEEKQWANEHLFIISGLYGILRPLDSIFPYRLELGYRLSPYGNNNLYTFWGDKLAKLIPKNENIINLTSVEYGRAIMPYLSDIVVQPTFLTKNIKLNKYVSVAVHSKIARGAMAHWLIVSKKENIKKFKELGYIYNNELSEPNKPVFVTERFLGLGLSVRLKNK